MISLTYKIMTPCNNKDYYGQTTQNIGNTVQVISNIPLKHTRKLTLLRKGQ